MDKSYVLDSYALIAHFEDDAGGGHVRNILRAAQEDRTNLYLSVINLGEIYYNTARERGVKKADEIKLIIKQLPITIVDADEEIAIEAARLKAIYPVAYADCFAAALGIYKNAKVVTGDPEFRRFKEKVKIEWIK